MNTSTATLTQASLQALAEAALVLEHAQDFVYLPLLVQSERAGALAVEHLRPALKSELFRVPWPLPQPHTDDPVEAEIRLQNDLQAVLNSLDGATRRLPAGAVLLLDAGSSVRQTVARRLPVFLNQRREDWRRLGQGLLLLWPQTEREALLQGAPDLWSMRAAAPWIDEQEAPERGFPPIPVALACQTETRSTTNGLSPEQQRQWQTLQGATHWADTDLSVADVLALVAALRKSRKLGDGLALAERVLYAQEFKQLSPHWLASLYNEIGLLRCQLGDWEGALAPAREALTMYRHLAKANPTGYEPNLAAILSTLANSLARIGEHSGALALAQEAVSIRRRLAQANPMAYEPVLAASLTNLSNHLNESGDRVGALVPSQEAVTIFRRLAMSSPSTYEPELATSLSNLGSSLSGIGDRAAALAIGQEAVTIHLRLARANPAVYEPELACSLTNLANRMSQAGDSVGALEKVQEVVAIHRRLAQSNPAKYESDLVLSLNNLSVHLNEIGDLAGAVVVAQEALASGRRLAQANPVAYEAYLALVLNNLANLLGATGRWAEALPLADEAVDIRRHLAQANPAAYEPNLATSLWTAMRCLGAVNRRVAALESGRESLQLFTRLAEREPSRFEPDRKAVEAELGQFNKT